MGRVVSRARATSITALVLVVELTPINTIIRGGVLGVSQLTGGGPIAGAVSLGLATLALELLTVLAVCRWVTSDGAGQVVRSRRGGYLTDRLARALGHPVLVAARQSVAGKGPSPGPFMALAALIVGAAVVVLAHQLARPDTGDAAGRRMGVRLAVFVAAVAAAQGFLLGWGWMHPTSLFILAATGLLAAVLLRVVRGRSVSPSPSPAMLETSA